MSSYVRISWRSWFPSAAIPLLGLITAPVPAQNRDHPGKVFADKLGWVSREEAAAKGYFEHERRWFPESMRKKLETWAADDAKHEAWKDARSLRTQHYRVTSNVPSFILELEIVPFLDELYETYVKVFREHYGLESKAANKKTIRIYRGYADYAANERDQGVSPPRTMPAFIVNGEELVAYYEDTDPGLFYGSAFHEGAHQFMAAVLPGADLPVWMDEAMATYFEGCTYSRATKKITVGFVPPDRLIHARELLGKEVAKNGESLADRLFFKVPKPSFDAQHYALAWSFVWYIVNRDAGKYRKHYASFLRATNGAGVRPIPEVFERATGVKLQTVEQGWQAAILALKPPEPPAWVMAEKCDNPALELKPNDRIWSLDGVEIFDLASWNRLWDGRTKDKEHTFVVLRRTEAPQPVGYTERFALVRAPPGLEVELAIAVDPNRSYNLRD